MDQRDWLAERFEEHRGRLKAVAYRMLGSPSEADDAVQEAWMRFSRSDTSDVENLGAWLTTVVSRVCLNMLQARRYRPEATVSDDLTEPTVTHPGGDPEAEALLGDSGRLLGTARRSGSRRGAARHGHGGESGSSPEVRGARELVTNFATRRRRCAGARQRYGRGRHGRPGGSPCRLPLHRRKDRIVGIELIADRDHLRELDLVIHGRL